ncbi:MAG: hypothetical protein M3N93_11645 [Acidobacteriota bacterium]|nr:hypothetical protein [Acidobacteriota bacterium]
MALVSVIFTGVSFGQTCSVSSSPVFVHQEGLAELVGSLNVTCTGGSGATVNPLIFVSLNGNVTNRLDANGSLTGITVTGTGVTTAQPPSLSSARTVSFSLSVPGTSPVFSISGLRVAVPSIGGGAASPAVTATVLATLLSFPSQPFVVAVSGPSLAESAFNYGAPCAGSPVPATIDIPTLISTGTISSTVRVTESSAAAFQPVTPGADFGMRLMLKLSGYPGGATVYVPDVIVGNRVPGPTTAGEFGSAATGGTYSPVGNPLLLVRVVGADAAGAGGNILFATPPGAATTYTTAFQVPLIAGAASVTYEVVDANGGLTDSAQIPVWVALPAYNCAVTTPATTLGATLVPVSTAAVATQTDPIPRYLATAPGSDCGIVGDCTAAYFPQLQASTGNSAPPALSLTGYSQGPKPTGYITLTDGGSNQYSFAVSVTYQPNAALSSANWLSFNATSGVVGPTAGVGSFTLAAIADPAALLIQGTYQATITINAGAAGTATIPVSFTVGPTQPTIQAVVNSANGQAGPVTANSFATIYGVNLVPKTTAFATVIVNGYPATVSYDGQPSATSPSQINFLVPPQLSGATAGVIATVDGTTTNNFAIQLAPNAPAVFNPGILNQNNTVNLAASPASRGDVVQIFLTGLATPVSVPVSVTMGAQSFSGNQLFYVGPVASIPGLEQINVQVPPSLSFTGNSVNLNVCIPGSGSQQTCSTSVPLYLK